MWWPLPYLTVCASGSKLNQNDRRRPSSYPARPARPLAATTLAPPRAGERLHAWLSCTLAHPTFLITGERRHASAPQPMQPVRCHPLCLASAKHPQWRSTAPPARVRHPRGTSDVRSRLRRASTGRTRFRALPAQHLRGAAAAQQQVRAAQAHAHADPVRAARRRHERARARACAQLSSLAHALPKRSSAGRLAPAVATGCTGAESRAGQRNPGVLSGSWWRDGSARVAVTGSDRDTRCAQPWCRARSTGGTAASELLTARWHPAHELTVTGAAQARLWPPGARPRARLS
jgi:hypothetical protein